MVNLRVDPDRQSEVPVETRKYRNVEVRISHIDYRHKAARKQHTRHQKYSLHPEIFVSQGSVEWTKIQDQAKLAQWLLHYKYMVIKSLTLLALGYLLENPLVQPI